MRSKVDLKFKCRVLACAAVVYGSSCGVGMLNMQSASS